MEAVERETRDRARPARRAGAPLIVGEELDLVRLGFGGRGVFVHERGARAVERFGVFAGQDSAGAGESVGGAVLGDAGFAFGVRGPVDIWAFRRLAPGGAVVVRT